MTTGPDPTEWHPLEEPAHAPFDPLSGLLAPFPPEHPPEEPADPHAVTETHYPWGTAWVCACRQWDAAATGPSSARWAGADHRRHVTEANRPKEPRSLP